MSSAHAFADAPSSDTQELIRQNALLKESNAHLELLVQKLRHQLVGLTRRQFGVSSEGAAQLGLYTAEELEAPSAPPGVLPTEVPAHARKPPVRRSLPEGLPRQVIDLDLAEQDKPCPCCGQARQVIGEEVCEKLDIEPARMSVLQYRRKKYACRACQGEVRTAAMPAQVIEQGMASPGLLAHVAVAKFVDHMPLARVERSLGRNGIVLARSTLTDWMIAIGYACEPIAERMGQVLRTLDYLGNDDTTLPWQDGSKAGKTRTARLWVWRGEVQDKVVLLYRFSEDRSGAHPAAFLEGWSGYLQVDAYSGYDALFAQGKIIEVGCLAHARRYFFEIAKAAKTPGFAHSVIQDIAELYRIEREAKAQGLGPEQIKAMRQERAPPIWARLKIKLESHYPKLLPKGPLVQAIGYMLRHWEALTRYLEDGRLHIDNNRVEGAIRPIAQGRNNYLFVASERGGRAAATLYSLVQSAIANGLNPYVYLRDVLTRIPAARDKDLDSLMPHLWRPAD